MATPEERMRALALLRRWGWNSTGFQVLERGFSYWFDGDDACVSYVDTGRAWVVAGAPIAAPERLAEVTRNFLAAARARARRACFFAVERRFIEAAGLPSLVVGEQASWDPREWCATLARRPSVREQLRRARAKGIAVRIVDSELRDRASSCRREVEALIERWLAAHALPPMSFLVDVQPFEFLEERRSFVAEQRGKVVGFLGAVPIFARGGWLFEHLLREPSAPNGTTELLVDAAMRSVAREGSTYATLGLAPLSGSVPTWLQRIGGWASALYDFNGLRAYKAKFAPRVWEPILLAHGPGTAMNVALYDTLVAFARNSLLGFGVRAITRRPALASPSALESNA